MRVVSPHAGLLTATVGAITISGVTLTGVDQQISYLIPMTVADQTGLKLGWNVQVTSTQFTTSGGSPHTLPTDAASIQSVSFVCNGICTMPNNALAYPIVIPAGSTPPAAVKMANAALLSGVGSLAMTATVQLSIPANSYVGTYASTLTVTIAAGP